VTTWFEAGRADGPPLFLLHGGTMTAHWNWDDELPAFAAYRVVAPDLPGHAGSTNPRPDLRYEDMVEDVLALAAELGIDRAAFYGFSDGAQVALELAIREPGFPTALVLSGVLHELTRAYFAGLREFAASDEFAQGRGYHRDWDTVARQVLDLWSRPLDLPPARLARVTAPALVLTGEHDPFIPLEQSEQLARLLPNAELAVIHGAGHDYDERFTQAALEFLGRHVPPG
jgi:pimeloyl-ACP methyl ester carboxylesterase